MHADTCPAAAKQSVPRRRTPRNQRKVDSILPKRLLFHRPLRRCPTRTKRLLSSSGAPALPQRPLPPVHRDVYCCDVYLILHFPAVICDGAAQRTFIARPWSADLLPPLEVAMEEMLKKCATPDSTEDPINFLTSFLMRNNPRHNPEAAKKLQECAAPRLRRPRQQSWRRTGEATSVGRADHSAVGCADGFVIWWRFRDEDPRLGGRSRDVRVDAQICVLDFWSLASHVRDTVLYVYVLRPAASMVHKVRKFGTGRCNSSKHCLELMNRTSPCIVCICRAVGHRTYGPVHRAPRTTVPGPGRSRNRSGPGHDATDAFRWSRSTRRTRSDYRAVYCTASPAGDLSRAARRWYPYCTSRVRYPIATLEIADRVSYRTTGQSLCLALRGIRRVVALAVDAGRSEGVGRREPVAAQLRRDVSRQQ